MLEAGNRAQCARWLLRVAARLFWRESPQNQEMCAKKNARADEKRRTATQTQSRLYEFTISTINTLSHIVSLCNSDVTSDVHTIGRRLESSNRILHNVRHSQSALTDRKKIGSTVQPVRQTTEVSAWSVKTHTNPPVLTQVHILAF